MALLLSTKPENLCLLTKDNRLVCDMVSETKFHTSFATRYYRQWLSSSDAPAACLRGLDEALYQPLVSGILYDHQLRAVTAFAGTDAIKPFHLFVNLFLALSSATKACLLSLSLASFALTAAFRGDLLEYYSHSSLVAASSSSSSTLSAYTYRFRCE